MSALPEIEQGIDRLLSEKPYETDPQVIRPALLSLLKKQVAYASEQNACFRNYVEHWPIDYRTAQRIADLPFLPVAVFKSDPPLSLVAPHEIRRTLSSSATTGQVPSRIVLDSATARRMSKGVITIVRDFIGSARRPYLVIDTRENLASHSHVGARAAAIQALGSFATEIVCCLQSSSPDQSALKIDHLLSFAATWRDVPVLVYGFTHLIWQQLVQPLQQQGIKLHMPNVHVLHSGGWKLLQQQAVTKEVFNQGVADLFSCSQDRIVDFYGMVENVGVIYPDCEYGNKHVPGFGEVIVRNPLTLESVEAGNRGLIQVCSVLPTSFPGFLLLTEDMADFIADDGCPCGRRGSSFRFAGRVPKAELRGCGNLGQSRYTSSAPVREVAWAT